jgi:hypothetical protein
VNPLAALLNGGGLGLAEQRLCFSERGPVTQRGEQLARLA